MPYLWLVFRQENYRCVSVLSNRPSLKCPRPANLHVTALDHGYIFTRYTVMNMSYVITEFSFGKHFPEMNQPIDNSSEVTHDSASLLLLESLRLADVPAEFVALILPACRSNNVRCPKEPLQTNQYSVTLRTTAQTAFGRPGNIL